MVRRSTFSLAATVLLFILGLAAPEYVSADTYRVPIHTATLAFQLGADADIYGPNPDPTLYNLQLDPSMLRVGYDSDTDTIYESIIIVDWNEFAGHSPWDIVNLTLQVSPVVNGEPLYYVAEFPANHSTPGLTDFDWATKFGCVVHMSECDASAPTQLLFADGNFRYNQWNLTNVYTRNTIGLLSPELIATTVPEPGSVLLLGFGLLAVFFVLRDASSSQSRL